MEFRTLPTDQALALLLVVLGLVTPWWRPSQSTADAGAALTFVFLLIGASVLLSPSAAQRYRALFGVYVLALPLTPTAAASQTAALLAIASGGLLAPPDFPARPQVGAVLLVLGGGALVVTNVYRFARDRRAGE